MIKLIAAGLLTLAALPAHASPFKIPGAVPAQEVYLGFAAGSASYRDLEISRKPATGKLLAGYMVNRTFGLEAQALELHTVTSTIESGISAKGLGLALIARVPLAPQVSGLIKAGSVVHQAKSDGDESHHGGYNLGLGVAWQVNPDLAARLDWERIGNIAGRTDVDLSTLGLQWRLPK